MIGGIRSRFAGDSAAQPGQHDRLAEQAYTDEREYDKGHRRDADHRDAQQHQQHRSQQCGIKPARTV